LLDLSGVGVNSLLKDNLYKLQIIYKTVSQAEKASASRGLSRPLPGLLP